MYEEMYENLNLSNRSRAFLKKKFLTIEGTVWHGRCIAFSRRHRLWIEAGEGVYCSELVDALSKAGLVKEFDPRLVAIWRLYYEVFKHGKHDESKSRLQEFLQDFSSSSGGEDLNREYEAFDPDVPDVEKTLKNILSEKEFEIITLSYGFEDGSPHSNLEIAETLGASSSEEVRRRATKAIMRLKRRRAELPLIFRFQSTKGPTEKTIPASHSEDQGGLETLGLNPRTTNTLKRAGFSDPAILAQQLREGWPQIRNIGAREKQRVEAALHEAGYY